MTDNKLMLSVLKTLACIGVPVGYLASFFDSIQFGFCSSKQPGTGPAVVFFLVMILCVIPVLVLKNKARHASLAARPRIAPERVTGAKIVLATMGIVALITPYLLVCTDLPNAGRALLVARALKESWLTLGIVGSFFSFAMYVACLIFLVYIPLINSNRPNL